MQIRKTNPHCIYISAHFLDYLGAAMAIQKSFEAYEEFVRKLAISCSIDPKEFQLPLLVIKICLYCFFAYRSSINNGVGEVRRLFNMHILVINPAMGQTSE